MAARPSVPLHRPQRRDQHRAGQPELDAGARGDAGEPAAPRPRAGLPDLHPRRVGHRPLRRGARTASPRRASDPPRRPDDDPGGVGERRRDGRRPAGVLPLPRVPDGTVGRAGQRRVHGRHRHRCGARPQRAPAEPLLGHRRRHRRDGLRGRRRRHRPGEGDHEGAPAAGADVPHRHRRRAHRRRRGDQDRPRRRAALRRVVGPGPRRVRGSPATRARRLQPLQRAAAPAALRLHPRRAEGDPRADGAQRHRTDRVDGHRHPDRRAVGPPAAAVRLLRPALRPGDEPAPRRDPRGGRDVGGVDRRSRGQPARARSAELSSAGPAVPDHRQRRAGQDHPRGRRRSLSRAAGARRQGVVPGGRRGTGAGAGTDRDLRRGVGGDRRRGAGDRSVRPQLGRRGGTDPVAAAHRGGAPPPRAHETADDGRTDRRVRRRPRGAPHGAAGRLRRRRDQPLPRVRVDRGPDRRGPPRPRVRRAAHGAA